MVVGSGVTGLGMVRSLGRRGIPNLLLAPPEDLAHRSRWARPFPGVEAGAAERPLAEVLEASPIESGVLIPGSDSAVREIASLPAGIAARFPSSVPSRQALDVLVDKQVFAAFMQEKALPHPRTVELNGAGPGLASVDRDLFERAFLKPRDSQGFFAHFGVKGVRVRDLDEAERRLEEIQGAGFEAVLQEYIPGPPTSHVFLDGFVDRHGELVLLLTRRRTRMHPADFGNSTLCETVSPRSVAPAVAALRRLLDTLSYRGIFSAEVKFDARCGAYRFLEVNARAWWYVEFAARCGVNVCEAAYLDALGESVPAPEEVPSGVRLLYPEYDLNAFRSLRRGSSRRGAPPAWSWFRPWIGARQALLVADDPWPAVWQVGGRLARRLGHLTGRRR